MRNILRNEEKQINTSIEIRQARGNQNTRKTKWIAEDNASNNQDTRLNGALNPRLFVETDVYKRQV